MTKQLLKKFYQDRGWSMEYSGKTRSIYIDPRDKAISLQDIEVVTAQTFGVLPDQKLNLCHHN